MPRVQAFLASVATVLTLLGVAVVGGPALAQDDTPQIRSGARVQNPPSGQNIRIWVRRAFVEPRGYNINSEYRGTVTSHPLEDYLRAGERRMEHCIDSAQHPRLELAPDLNGNTVVRARIVISAAQITQVEMSESPLSQIVEQCMRAGFERTRGHLPRNARVIATFYMRPRTS